MTNPTISRPAAQLVVGDRIAARFLPTGEPAEVVFATSTGGRVPRALVVYRFDDGYAAADEFLANVDIPLEYTADSFGYSREADDPTPVSPARVPPHTGYHEATVAGCE